MASTVTGSHWLEHSHSFSVHVHMQHLSSVWEFFSYNPLVILKVWNVSFTCWQTKNGSEAIVWHPWPKSYLWVLWILMLLSKNPAGSLWTYTALFSSLLPVTYTWSSPTPWAFVWLPSWKGLVATWPMYITWKLLQLWIGAVAKGLQDTQTDGTLYLWEKIKVDTKLQ